MIGAIYQANRDRILDVIKDSDPDSVVRPARPGRPPTLFAISPGLRLTSQPAMSMDTGANRGPRIKSNHEPPRLCSRLSPSGLR